MLTGKSNQDIIVQAFRYGVQDFLHKKYLTKILLFESIQRATKQHREEQVKSDTITLSAHIFNKSKFLKKIELAELNDVVLVIEVDDYQGLHDEFGIILTEKICAHIAKITSKAITRKELEGVVICSGDAAIAALLKSHADFNVSEKFSKILCKAFKKYPYVDDDHSIEYTVSIGVAVIDKEKFDPETIFISADVACRIARNNKDNSYII